MRDISVIPLSSDGLNAGTPSLEDRVGMFTTGSLRMERQAKDASVVFGSTHQLNTTAQKKHPTVRLTLDSSPEYHFEHGIPVPAPSVLREMSKRYITYAKNGPGFNKIGWLFLEKDYIAHTPDEFC